MPFQWFTCFLSKLYILLNHQPVFFGVCIKPKPMQKITADRSMTHCPAWNLRKHRQVPLWRRFIQELPEIPILATWRHGGRSGGSLHLVNDLGMLRLQMVETMVMMMIIIIIIHPHKLGYNFYKPHNYGYISTYHWNCTCK